MSTFVPMPIPVDGPLDTASPESSRPTGALVQATDTAHRWLGPRPGRSLATTAQGNAFVVRTAYEFDGATQYGLFRYLAEQMTLPLEWTLDVLFEPTAVGTSSGTMMSFGNSTHTDIRLYLDGSGAGGALPRTTVCTVKASSTSGGVGNAVTVRDTTQRALAAVGTPATDPTLIYHARVVRNGADLSLKVNGTETTGTGLDTGTGHAYAGDGIYLAAHSTLANNYYGGWIYKVLIRSGLWNDLSDSWMDTTASKAPCVLFWASGGQTQLWVGSTAAQENSRFKNYGTVVNAPPTDDLSASPFQFPVQLIGGYVDRAGRQWNLVAVNGRLFYQQAT